MLSETLGYKKENNASLQLYDAREENGFTSFLNFQKEARKRFESLLRKQLHRFHKNFDQALLLTSNVNTHVKAPLVDWYSLGASDTPPTVILLKLFSREISQLTYSVYIEVMEHGHTFRDETLWEEFREKCGKLDTDLAHYNKCILSDKLEAKQRDLDKREEDVHSLLKHIETFPALLLSQGDNGTAVHDAALILHRKITAVLGVSKETGMLYGQVAFADDIQGILRTLRQLCGHIPSKHNCSISCDDETVCKRSPTIYSSLQNTKFVCASSESEKTTESSCSNSISPSVLSCQQGRLKPNRDVGDVSRTKTSSAPLASSSFPPIHYTAESKDTPRKVTTISSSSQSSTTQMSSSSDSLPKRQSTATTPASSATESDDDIVKVPKSIHNVLVSTSYPTLALAFSSSTLYHSTQGHVSPKASSGIPGMKSNCMLVKWSPANYVMSSPIMSFNKSLSKSVRLSSATSSTNTVSPYQCRVHNLLRLSVNRILVPRITSLGYKFNLLHQKSTDICHPSTITVVDKYENDMVTRSMSTLTNTSSIHELKSENWYPSQTSASTYAISNLTPRPSAPRKNCLRAATAVANTLYLHTSGSPHISASDDTITCDSSRNVPATSNIDEEDTVKNFIRQSITKSHFAQDKLSWGYKRQQNHVRACLSSIIFRDKYQTVRKSWSDSSIYSKHRQTLCTSDQLVNKVNSVHGERIKCVLMTTVLMIIIFTLSLLVVLVNKDTTLVSLELLDIIVEVKPIGESVY